MASLITVRGTTAMAKGQKKSNKEVRKPKATKTAAPLATSNLMEKGLVMPGSGGKKK